MSAAKTRLIFHVDINSCYASCEKIFDPSLRDKPVVVLSNNDGCIIALDQQAKALGFAMGDPWFKVAEAARAQGVVARSSNYELYGDISDRVMLVLKEYAADFEQYSVDEAFLTAPVSAAEAVRLARRIKSDLARRVKVPSCVGVAPTKTLAKLANKTAKKIPALKGVCVWEALPAQRRQALFEALPVSEVWGVGPRTARKLAGMGLVSIADLVQANPATIRQRFSVVLMRTLLELRGIPTLALEEERAFKDQLIYSRSFSSPVTEGEQMRQVLSIYAQRASARLMKQGQVAGQVAAFCSTSFYAEGPQSHPSVRARLEVPSADPLVLLDAARGLLEEADFGLARYVRAGFMLLDLAPAGAHQLLDPFVPEHQRRGLADLLGQIQSRCGEASIGLGYGGLARPPGWEMRREFLSKRATTHWEELAVARLD